MRSRQRLRRRYSTICPAPLPEQPSFLLIARLLGDKGIREYAQAAKLLKATNAPLLTSPRRTTAWSPPPSSQPTPNQGPRTKNQKPIFLLAGNLDPNPASISQAELDTWTSSSTLEHLGYLDDVRPAYEQCSVYVLPSYREGTPRTVLYRDCGDGFITQLEYKEQKILHLLRKNPKMTRQE